MFFFLSSSLFPSFFSLLQFPFSSYCLSVCRNQTVNSKGFFSPFLLNFFSLFFLKHSLFPSLLHSQVDESVRVSQNGELPVVFGVFGAFIIGSFLCHDSLFFFPYSLIPESILLGQGIRDAISNSITRLRGLENEVPNHTQNTTKTRPFHQHPSFVLLPSNSSFPFSLSLVSRLFIIPPPQ